MGGPLTLARCRVDLDRGEVEGPHGCACLTSMEVALLRYLADRPGQAVSREELLREVWGYSPDTVSRAADAAVNRLRAKIEADPSEPVSLQTAWGEGYRLVLPEEEPPALAGVQPDLDRSFGRTSEHDAVLAWLDDGERLVTILGPGGMGKSRLARGLARAVSREGPVRFVALAEVREGERVSARVAEVLGATASGGDPGEDVVRALRRMGAVLLVLDNVEQLVAPVSELVLDWLAQAPEARIVLTSRQRLRVAGERVLDLGPLPAADAVALLRDRVSTPVGTLSDAQAAEVVRRVDGMPLGIELAAALLDVLPASAVLERLDHPLDALDAQRRDRPHRHTTLRRALAGSWTLLSREEQRALAGCSLFRGGIDPAAAEAVLAPLDGGVLRHLRALRAQSLLTVDERTGRLALLDTVRAFAREHLRDDDPLWERFVTWFADGAARRVRPEGRVPSADEVAWIRAEQDNLEAALQRASGVDFARIVFALAHLYRVRGPVRRALELLTRALDHALPSSLRGHLLRMRCLLHLTRQDHAALHADLEAGLAIARGEADGVLEGRLLVVQGIASLRTPAQAEVLLRQAISVLQAAGDEAYAATARSNLATALRAQVRDAEAAETWSAALEQHRALGNTASTAVAVGNLGLLASERGHLDQAQRHLDEALRLHRRVVNRAGEGVILTHLGWVFIQRFDAEGARARFGAAAAHFERLGDSLWTMQAELGLVYADLLDACPRQALDRLYDRVMCEPGQSASTRTWRARLLAGAHLLAGDVDEAQRRLDALGPIPERPRTAWLHGVIEGLIAAEQGQPDRVDAAWRTARDAVDAGGNALAPRALNAPWFTWLGAARNEAARSRLHALR